MSQPEVKLFAVSNVFSRLMHFVKKGDTEEGHKHIYDHGTLLSTGSVLVEMIDDAGNIIGSKEFVAPTFIFVEKNINHRLTALEDNTICACIHALRSVDDDLIDPDFLVTPIDYGDVEKTDLADKIKEKYNKQMMYFKRPNTTAK
jgi:hypothetical protein